ncbi:MAG: sugar phosphate isomerase/epimerase [Dehalococcoidales bacterium]|nr:sugar phosphate isomerase/epimerase [Dehalococcoidales bacterium]
MEDSLIWTEEFTEKDLPLIEKAKDLGFDAIDINVSHPERFPARKVVKKIKEVGNTPVTTIGLSADSDLISPEAKVRQHGIETMKKMVDINVAEDAVKYCKAVGTGNIKVHLDAFHMIREESNFSKAVNTCGKEYLGYIHVCENNRGILGTGLLPWKEFLTPLRKLVLAGR